MHWEGKQEGHTGQKSWGMAPMKLWFERKVAFLNVHVCGGTHDAHELNNLSIECLVRSAPGVLTLPQLVTKVMARGSRDIM
jgi:hypothetical protein